MRAPRAPRVEPDVQPSRDVALRAQTNGLGAVAALAIGTAAIGALAIGAVAIGRLAVGRARIRVLRIDHLHVGRLIRDDFD